MCDRAYFLFPVLTFSIVVMSVDRCVPESDEVRLPDGSAACCEWCR